jgi:hypothetical protein
LLETGTPRGGRVPVRVAAQTAWVTGEALAALDTEGRFRFPLGTAVLGELPVDTARNQGLLFARWRLNSSFGRGMVEGQREAFVDAGRLAECGRGYLRRSPYGPPPDSVPASIRQTLGDFWVVPFCDRPGVPALLVGVAALANSVRFTSGGIALPDTTSGNAYFTRGVPWYWEDEMFVSPEVAVAYVHQITGLRVSRPPELVHGLRVLDDFLLRDVSIVCPRWRLQLERPIRVRGFMTLRELNATELYVLDDSCTELSGGLVLAVPLPDQPATEVLRYRPTPNAALREVPIPLVGPTRLESVSPLR